MIFKNTWKQVLDGSKTQTRRLVKEGDELWEVTDETGEICQWVHGKRVHGKSNRLRWMVGSTYAVQPEHGKDAVGRIRLTAIRREALYSITAADIIAEGVPTDGSKTLTEEQYYTALHNRFARLWDSVNLRPGTQFFDNPNVWVLTFELV